MSIKNKIINNMFTWTFIASLLLFVFALYAINQETPNGYMSAWEFLAVTSGGGMLMSIMYWFIEYPNV